jgi:MinD-like ATPase involved in chromosome partitioning or flagellar assembly
MSPDVQHLLESLRAPGFTYRETGRLTDAAPEDVSGPRDGERVIVVVSPLAGTGRTTIAAAVAEALASAGWAIVALDLDQKNELRHHLRNEANGASLSATEGGHAEARPSPACVPFGAPSAYLSAVAAEPDAVVLDTAAGLSRALEDVLAPADEVIVALRADAPSRGAVPAVDALLARARLRGWRRFRARYVVNAFDGRRATHRAELAALRDLLGARLWPRPLQWDGDVGRARLAGRALADVAPASQLALELGLLARDLMAGHGGAAGRGDTRAG